MPVNSTMKRPYISSVSPAAVPIGTQNVTLTVKGRDFAPENRLLWDETDLHPLSVTPTEIKAQVPDEFLRKAGTYKIHMITGGRVRNESLNFMEVMVTYGRRFEERWNGQKRSTEF
jgi:hypothetical protein